jgi:hypothetical protein
MVRQLLAIFVEMSARVKLGERVIERGNKRANRSLLVARVVTSVIANEHSAGQWNFHGPQSTTGLGVHLQQNFGADTQQILCQGSLHDYLAVDGVVAEQHFFDFSIAQCTENGEKQDSNYSAISYVIEQRNILIAGKNSHHHIGFSANMLVQFAAEINPFSSPFS